MKAKRPLPLAMTHLPGAILMIFAAACDGCSGAPPPPPRPLAMSPPTVAPPPLPVPAAPCDQAQLLATSTSMQARAAAEAPGMKPEGPPYCAVVAEGQTFASPTFILEAGYAYTFLGQSLPPVGQMEMLLQFDATTAVGPFLPPSMSGMAAMGQSALLVTTTPGERVAMGQKPSYYQWGFPLVPATVKLVLRARAGSGPIAAQVFKKKL